MHDQKKTIDYLMVPKSCHYTDTGWTDEFITITDFKKMSRNSLSILVQYKIKVGA